MRVALGPRWWSCGCKITQAEAVVRLNKRKMRKPKKELMTPWSCATEAYYVNMTLEQLKAERKLEDAIAGAAKGVDFDTEE